jgi:hypothetical protein
MYRLRIMPNQQPRQDLLVTKRHSSFSPGFLKTVYPVLSPYAALDDYRGDRKGHAPADSKCELWSPEGSLPLSTADAVDLVIATSGFFRDYVGKNE